MPSRSTLLSRVGPGILLAATGVGAGDLATASFTGSHLGTAILWAVVLGAFFKYVLTEGLTRWQLATGETLIEGVAARVGRVGAVLFLPYFIFWSFFVGSALMSATGVTLHAMFPVFESAAVAKNVFAIAASVAAMGMVLAGGFPLFEKVMSVCIGLMFATVVLAVGFLWPGTAEVAQGLFIPRIPAAGGQGPAWTIALVGGVGGTVTMLCYGYWIREKGRAGAADLAACRLDLGLGYLMTAIFGCAMVIIGSGVSAEGSGAQLLVVLSDRLGDSMGPIGRWLFLIGAFGAVFSSVLGVWQSVPYIFADIWRVFFDANGAKGLQATEGVDTRAAPYRWYLAAITFVPMLGLFMNFRDAQRVYATVGALFLPLLAVTLLFMNGRRKWVGPLVNRWPSILVLAATLVFFGVIGWASGGG